MIQIKVLKFFLENPYNEVYLRELARRLKLSGFAAKKYLDLFVKEGLVKAEKRANLRYFKADVNNLCFRYIKIAFNLNQLLKSGLMGFLKENIANLSAIVLFGSMAKGEDDLKSDVDLLIIGKSKHLNLDDFEDTLNRKITIHVFSWSDWNKKVKDDNAFYYEVISHGISLYGELPLIKWK